MKKILIIAISIVLVCSLGVTAVGAAAYKDSGATSGRICYIKIDGVTRANTPNN